MASYNPAALKARLTLDEGRKAMPYRDSMGFMTVGIGHNLAIAQSDFAIDALYDSDIRGCEASLDQRFPWWRSLDPVRQIVMMDMMFNMGGAKLSQFVHFLAAMQSGNWTEAAAQMMNSAWANQVGARATRLKAMVLTGVDPMQIAA